MRKVALLTMLSLTSCFMLPSNLKSNYHPIEEFEISQVCPHICWMGIRAGTTTAEEALVLLKASDRIDHESTLKSILDIRTIWYAESNVNSFTRVYLDVDFESGLVESISFADTPFTIKGLVTLAGEPDELSISLVRVADAQYVEYTIYYSSLNVVARVLNGGENGPDSDDRITNLVLNIDISSEESPLWLKEMNSYRQPWLGYGHLKDYLTDANISPEYQLP